MADQIEAGGRTRFRRDTRPSPEDDARLPGWPARERVERLDNEVRDAVAIHVAGTGHALDLARQGVALVAQAGQVDGRRVALAVDDVAIPVGDDDVRETITVEIAGSANRARLGT